MRRMGKMERFRKEWRSERHQEMKTERLRKRESGRDGNSKGIW